MSDRDDARVRALLAEVGSDTDAEQLPPEVAARLDDALSRLVAERAGHPSGNVVPLRRRRSPRVLAAAAAVIVVAAGGLAAANLGGFGGGGSTGSSTAAKDSAAGGSTSESLTQEEEQSPGPPSAPEKASASRGSVPELRSVSFASDVAALERRDTLLFSAPDTSPSSSPDTSQDTNPAAACPGPPSTDGSVGSPVRLDGRPAVLLVHPERAGRRLVEAWSCAGDRRLAGAVLTR